ncbi:hypothetical protein [Streptomyces sp. JJ38]|uniref:hypothetical protein n=1 Tax=Streptomyces sp. JJ38 TaxID=2738128 RepID=UPI001C55DBE9|nr:hypothetical protein [Streptomyces sp. JJ38]MBW1599202.1 hypothetical protein [Streptomyces sp. JJ38]
MAEVVATDTSFVGHDPINVLLLAFGGLIATAVVGVYSLVRATDNGFGGCRGTTAGLRTAGSAALGGAIAVYTWGLLHLVVLDATAQAKACRDALGGAELLAYEPSYLPLAFGCVAADGGTHDVIVPGYVSPVAGLLGGGALLLAALSFGEAYRQKADA